MWEIISSVLTGGATGLIGVAVSGYLEHKKQQEKNKHELLMIEAERQTMALEIQGRERVAAIDAESAENIAEVDLIKQSMQLDKATYSQGDSKWLIMVDVIRGLTRPTLTILLITLTTVIWFTSEDVENQKKIVATVLYVTTAAILWWFGSRVKQPK